MVMRDVATMHADVIAQNPARLGRIPTLPAYPGELPAAYSCVEPYSATFSWSDTTCYSFPHGKLEWTQQHCYVF